MFSNHTLNTDENLKFLMQKTQEIKIALFKAEISSLLRLPNNIITTLKTDSDGNIWFFTSCNGNYAKNIDKSFYAYLEYYQKGTDSRLRISGKASICEDDPEAYTSISNKSLPGNQVLIKLKILEAEYFENKPIVTTSFKETCRNFFYQLFYGHTYKQFDV
jgi:general stress protein 26